MPYQLLKTQTTHPFIVNLHKRSFEHVVNIFAVLNQLEEIQKRAEDEAMTRILWIGFAHELQFISHFNDNVLFDCSV